MVRIAPPYYIELKSTPKKNQSKKNLSLRVQTNLLPNKASMSLKSCLSFKQSHCSFLLTYRIKEFDKPATFHREPFGGLLFFDSVDIHHDSIQIVAESLGSLLIYRLIFQNLFDFSAPRDLYLILPWQIRVIHQDTHPIQSILLCTMCPTAFCRPLIFSPSPLLSLTSIDLLFRSI